MTEKPAKIAVLVMAYGGPDSLDDVEPYLLDVRNYRPTSAEIVHEIRERYAKIGGRSPIRELTNAQAAGLQQALDRGDGAEWTVFVGMRHWHPFIQDVLPKITAAGFDRMVGLVMAPHYSRMSIGAYFKKIADAGTPLAVAPVERWHLLPGYLDAVAERVEEALQRFPEGSRGTVPIVFTAHSLPERILEWNDPYPVELGETVAALAERFPGHPFTFAYQSAAMTPDPWLGPDAGEVIASYAEQGIREVLIAPIGFVSDHVEILFDIDVEFTGQAKELGVHLERIRMVNDHPGMMSALAELVRERAAAEGWL
jgi:ferrochelatase